jgi:outer membrane protein assembly factor BamB
MVVMVTIAVGGRSGMADEGAVARNAARVQQLEQAMPVGPRSAKELGLRVAWRHPIAVNSITGIFISNGAAFLVDSENEVTMLDLKSGQKQWVGFGGGKNDIIIDVQHLPSDSKVLIVRSHSILTLASSTGIPIVHGASQTSMQQLEWLAATPGFVHENTYIYGGLSGEVVWQGWDMGFSLRAHRIGRRVASPPVLAGRAVLTGSRSGALVALDADTGTLLWQKQLLDSISGVPATSSSLAVVASRDQHIRTFDTASGKLKWARLFEQPLTSGPVLNGSAVYQQVPETGLVRFEAVPRNAPSGIEVWTAADVQGDVIGTTGDLLLVWTPEATRLQTVSASTGSVDATINANNVSLMKAKDNTLLLLGGDGELECLRPALGR